MHHVRMFNVWKIISIIRANMTIFNVGKLKLGCQHVNGMIGIVGSRIPLCSGLVTKRKASNVYLKSTKNLVSKMMKIVGERHWHFLAKIVKKMQNVSKSFTTCQTAKMTILIAGRNCIGVQTARRAICSVWRKPCTFLTVLSKKMRYHATRNGCHIQIVKWTTESVGRTGMTHKIQSPEECSGILPTVIRLQPTVIALWALEKWWIIKEEQWRKCTKSIENLIWKGQDWWHDDLKQINSFCIWINCY